MVEDAEDLRRSFTRRYVLALSLIAALASLSLAVIYVMTLREESRAEVLGLANGQRALSQRIAFHLNALDDVPNADQRAELRLELDASLRAMERAHEILTGRTRRDSGVAAFTKPIHAIYFDTDEPFDAEVRRFLGLARDIVAADAAGEEVPAAKLHDANILARSSIMQTHEIMARILEHEARRSVTIAELTQTTLWALIIFCIVVEAPLIFAPLGRGIERSIVAIRTAEADARREAERAKAAYEAKSKFLRIMSHELRTPLNAVLGLTDLVSRAPEAPESRRYLKHVRDAGDHMLQLVNDVLDASSLATGTLSMEPWPSCVHEIAEGSLAMLAERAERKGLRLELVSTPDQEVQVDPGRLRQVLINLIGNAVKFTDAGAVIVRVDQTELDGTRARIRFEVEDTGPGIPAADIERIFEEFVQADAGAHGERGTGLGLSISRSIVEQMGGSISVESEPGEGSVFRVFFEAPLARAVVRQQRDERAAGGSGEILVVDDNLPNRLVVKAFLESAGYSVVLAENGAEAIAVVQDRSQLKLVLMDIDMPVMRGDEATRRLRSTGGRIGALPIVALTANVLPEDRDTLFEAGVDDMLAKPVRRDALLSTVARAIGDERAPSGRSAA